MSKLNIVTKCIGDDSENEDIDIHVNLLSKSRLASAAIGTTTSELDSRHDKAIGMSTSVIDDIMSSK